MSFGRAHVEFTKVTDSSINLQEEGTCYLTATIPPNKPYWETLPLNKIKFETPCLRNQKFKATPKYGSSDPGTPATIICSGNTHVKTASYVGANPDNPVNDVYITCHFKKKETSSSNYMIYIYIGIGVIVLIPILIFLFKKNKHKKKK